MDDCEFDDILTRRVKECVAEKRLPGDFSDRLVRSVHCRRHARRMKMVAAVVAIVAVAVAVFGVFAPEKPKSSGEATLIAARTPGNDAQVSGWMLFGVLRECFKRNKTGKRKEEEQ